MCHMCHMSRLLGSRWETIEFEMMLECRKWSFQHTVLTLSPMGSNPTYLLWGGGIWPPLCKMSESWKLVKKLGRVPRGGLNITLKPKNPHPGCWWCPEGILEIPPPTALCRDLHRDTIGFSLPGFDKIGITFDRNMEMPRFFQERFITKL